MTTFTGGCQCGHVRFKVLGPLKNPHLCHCRMCQKAVGNAFAALVSPADDRIVWTKAEPKRFRSSNQAVRGFCPECGTPLSYEASGGVALAMGAFDDPGAFAPAIQCGMEGKLPWVDGVASLPGSRTADDVAVVPSLRDIVSYQHPDHDT